MCAVELDSLQLPPKMPAVSYGSPNSATVITEKCLSVFDDPGLSPPIDEAFSTNLDAIAVMQADKAGAPFCAMKD
jgi:hypothetical protein